MQTKWISVDYERPERGEVVFASNGVKRDQRFPVAVRYTGRRFVGVSNGDAGKVYDSIRFWFPRDGLPEVPVLPGCYSLDSLAETKDLLLSISATDLGLSDSWVNYRHDKAKAFFSWVPGETRLEVEPVSLVAELNVWSAPLDGRKPADLDFFVRAREHDSGDLVLIGRGEWDCGDIPTRSEIERRKLELATCV